jgi:phosphomannomutase
MLDGLKLLFGDDAWLLFRPSGTEPVLRLYCEAPTLRVVTDLLRHAVRLSRI